MKRLAPRVCWIVVCVLAVAIAASAGSVAPAAAPSPAATQPTSVSLGDLHPFLYANAAEYVIGEPVFLHLVLANWSQTAKFAVQGSLHPANNLEINVARSRELPIRYYGGGNREKLYPGITFQVPPRQLGILRTPLCYEPDHGSGFLFDQTGVYTISVQARLRVNDAERVLTLPPIQITVKEPTASQAKVLELVMRPENAEDLQNLEAQDATADLWQQVADQFPDSLWAPYARLLLAERLLEASTAADFGALFQQLEAALRTYPRFPLRSDLYYCCARCQDRLGRPVEVLRWLYRLQREFPVGFYAQANTRMYRKYVTRVETPAQVYSPWYLTEY